MEKKLINLSAVKFTATETETDTDTKTFSGYGAVFGNVDSYGDVIDKGAFKATLKRDAAPMMFLNHDPYSLPIGRWTKLEEDDFGLKVEGEFIDTTAGRDAYIASKSGAITGLSIGFRPQEVKLGKPGSDEPIRTIKSVELMEISVVTFPANGKARISDVKSFEEADEFERVLMRQGMTLAEAKDFLANHSAHFQTKYNEAVTLSVANKLLSTIKETHV